MPSLQQENYKLFKEQKSVTYTTGEAGTGDDFEGTQMLNLANKDVKTAIYKYVQRNKEEHV